MIQNVRVCATHVHLGAASFHVPNPTSNAYFFVLLAVVVVEEEEDNNKNSKNIIIDQDRRNASYL